MQRHRDGGGLDQAFFQVENAAAVEHVEVA